MCVCVCVCVQGAEGEGGVEVWRVNPSSVQSCISHIVNMTKMIHSDDSRYFNAVCVQIMHTAFESFPPCLPPSLPPSLLPPSLPFSSQ